MKPNGERLRQRKCHSEPIPRKGSGGTAVDFTRPLAGIGSVISDVSRTLGEFPPRASLRKAFRGAAKRRCRGGDFCQLKLHMMVAGSVGLHTAN